MNEHTKIGVSRTTHQLVKDIAKHEHRSMADQVAYWAADYMSKEDWKHKTTIPKVKIANTKPAVTKNGQKNESRS